jgi:hypothetical protein
VLRAAGLPWQEAQRAETHVVAWLLDEWQGAIIPSAEVAPDLRAALTRALQPHLPPEMVAVAVDGVLRIERQPVNMLSGTPATWAASQLRQALPEPYRSAAAIAEAIAPIVADYWQRRLVEVEAGSVTVSEHRP